MDFYSYQLMVRDPISHLHRACALFSQFIVDMFAKVEAERCLWVRLNQKTLRADKYSGLMDDINTDGTFGDKGQMVVLPSTHVGSPRYMHERTQDGMKYVQTFGRPDFFITFTCNPNWKEIKDQLLPGQKPQDRHDIVARVFQQKKRKLIDLIEKSNIFGTSVARMYSIEWQKRGLPHCHLLLWMKEKIKAEDVDKIISAEIPDPKEDPKLHDIVMSHMVHGPCGHYNRDSPCMVDNKCSKQFPKPFMKETQHGTDGYPSYRRRKGEDGGQKGTKTIKRGKTVEVDNSWIVP